MKEIKTLLLLLIVSITCNAQVTIAKLNFEDAEQAFNDGRYQLSLDKLAEAEKIFGKINLPILHLRILNQDKLLDARMDYMLLFELKKNCTHFLKEYESTEGVEDKYRQVYKIAEKYSAYPSTKEELEQYRIKEKEKEQHDASLIREVLDREKRVTGEAENGGKINSVYFKYKVENGYPKINSTIESTIFKDSHLSYVYHFGATVMSKAIFNRLPDDYFYEFSKGKRKLTPEEQVSYALNVHIFNDLDKPSILKEIQTGSFKGKQGYLISYYIPGMNKSQIFYDASSGLALFSKYFYPDNKTVKSYAIYESWKSIEGVSFSADQTIYTYDNINEPEKFNLIKLSLIDLKANIKFHEKDFR